MIVSPTGLIDITSLALEEVRERAAAAMASPDASSELADFLASVSWSHSERADPAVRLMLGRLEQADTSYAEGDIDASAFRDEVILTINSSGSR